MLKDDYKKAILAIGDNVCDKYLSRGKMYPGGQCVNTCAYVAMHGMKAAYRSCGMLVFHDRTA